MKLLGFNERIEYVAGMCLAPEHDIVTLDGLGYDGLWYMGHRISTGEVLTSVYYPLVNFRFDFGSLRRFDFPRNTIRDVRRRNLIEQYEQRHGKNSGEHIENLISMPWEQIWKVVQINDFLPRAITLFEGAN